MTRSANERWSSNGQRSAWSRAVTVWKPGSRNVAKSESDFGEPPAGTASSVCSSTGGSSSMARLTATPVASAGPKFAPEISKRSG